MLKPRAIFVVSLSAVAIPLAAGCQSRVVDVEVGGGAGFLTSTGAISFSVDTDRRTIDVARIDLMSTQSIPITSFAADLDIDATINSSTKTLTDLLAWVAPGSGRAVLRLPVQTIGASPALVDVSATSAQAIPLTGFNLGAFDAAFTTAGTPWALANVASSPEGSDYGLQLLEGPASPGGSWTNVAALAASGGCQVAMVISTAGAPVAFCGFEPLELSGNVLTLGSAALSPEAAANQPSGPSVISGIETAAGPVFYGAFRDFADSQGVIVVRATLGTAGTWTWTTIAHLGPEFFATGSSIAAIGPSDVAVVLATGFDGEGAIQLLHDGGSAEWVAETVGPAQSGDHITADGPDRILDAGFDLTYFQRGPSAWTSASLGRVGASGSKRVPASLLN